ncbi:MAG: hypothetical protein QXS20_09395 [Candidatus Thorarchaeota archaeon]
MGQEGREPGRIIKFVQDYRMKMLIPELLVVFGVWYFFETIQPGLKPWSGNAYGAMGVWALIFQPLYFLPTGLTLLLCTFLLHGIYPMDNYHEGKISVLPRGAIIMVIIAFVFLPVLVAFQMLGYFMTEATEYFSRNAFWERFESVGDLLFYAGPMFFVGQQWWLLLPVFFLSQAVDGIHKVAHHETSNTTIAMIFYFLWPITIPLFFEPVEIIAMAALSIPAFAFYTYIRPYYTYVTAVHTVTFALLVLVTLFVGNLFPIMNLVWPGFIPPHTPPPPTW